MRRRANLSTGAFVLGADGAYDSDAALAVNVPDYNKTNGRVRVEKTATAWLLAEAQYESFRTTGLTAANLNGATLGTGAADVFEGGSEPTLNTLDTNSRLGLYSFLDVVITFDELRISDASLAETAPGDEAVPVPVTSFSLACGFVTLLFARGLSGAAEAPNRPTGQTRR